MTDLTSDVARRAASRLASDLGPDLPAFTERALAQGAEPSRQRSYDVATTISMASLLLSVVQFGWQAYRDLKEDREKREKDEQAAALDRGRTLQVLVRRMRLSLTQPTDLTPQQRDRLLEVVAEEILAAEDLPD